VVTFGSAPEGGKAVPTPAATRRRDRKKQRRVTILDRPPSPLDAASGDEILLACPWMKGLPQEGGPWLAALCIHDCNAFLDDDWVFGAAPEIEQRTYFGIFAADRLRSAEGLLALLRRRGIGRIVNFPSVSFFDGAMSQTLGALGFTVEAERDFLLKARQADFRIGFCSDERSETRGHEGLQADFWLRHRGPGQPFVLGAAR
jgi:hypothetical protein